MNDKLEKNLNDALTQLVPDELYQRIEQELDGQPKSNIVSFEQAKKKKKSGVTRFLSTAVAACLVLVVGLWRGGLYYQDNFVPVGVVDIDVNPSIELTANRQNKILSVTAVNEDAAALLDGMNLKHLDMKTAVNAIVGAMVQSGYLAQDGDNSILVSVRGDNTETVRGLRNLVLTDLNETLTDSQLKAEVLNQTLTKDAGAENLAKTAGISIGKANLVLHLVQKDNTLSAEALAEMSLREIAALVQERRISIHDLVDYDADDSIWENISDAVEAGDAQGALNSVPNHLTPAEAKALALQYAGLTGENVTFVKVEADYEDGNLVYEVEFLYDGMEYEYELDPSDGKIVDEEQETYEDAPVLSEGHGITAEQTKEIALKEVGVSKSQVTEIEVEHKVENGVELFEVDIELGECEYSVEVSVLDGTILSAKFDAD